MNTTEGYTTAPTESNEMLDEALTELTPEQENQLGTLFPNGPQSEEDSLLYERYIYEMATNPDGFNAEEVKNDFLEKRQEALSKGGFEATEYSVDKSGVVTPGDPLEHFKENQ